MQFNLISGGQSGVDQAALDVAVESGISYSGYIPSCGAENFSAAELLVKYPKLQLTSSDDSNVRTALNIFKSDIIVTIAPNLIYHSPGTKFGIELAANLKKSSFILSPQSKINNVVDYINVSNFRDPKILVGGPRQSEWTDGHDESTKIISELFEHISVL